METQLYARVLDGVVAEPPIAFDPDGFYAPEIVASFVRCPADTRQGATYDAKKKTFANPPAPPEPGPADAGPGEPTYRTIMTPIRFKAQFSVMAQVKIKRARAYKDGADTDAASDERKAFARDALDILFGSLDDPRLTEVDVADPAVIGGVDFVHSLGILTADEAAEIKRGVPL